LRDSAGLVPDFAEFHGTRLSPRAGTYYSGPGCRASLIVVVQTNHGEPRYRNDCA